MQLIERLKQKQMRQRTAYQQLEAVLALGTRCVSVCVTVYVAASHPSLLHLYFSSPHCCLLARFFLPVMRFVCGLIDELPSHVNTHTHLCPRSSRKSTSKSGSGQNTGLTGTTPPPQGEPTEEEVARAFSMYDTEATGEISTSSVDGEFWLKRKKKQATLA